MESVRPPRVSVCGVYATAAMMPRMDIVSVLLGILMFSILIALIYGIDRI
jgi:hypothetical protein